MGHKQLKAVVVRGTGKIDIANEEELDAIYDESMVVISTRAMTIGERIWNLKKLFNIREGFGRSDGKLPPRFLKTPLPEGGSRERTVYLEKMLEEYVITSEGGMKVEHLQKIN